MSKKKSDASQEVAGQLHSLAIQLLRKLRREDDSSGLNAPRLSALSVIVFGGPVTLGDLAAAEQVQPPTMTRIVHALEKQGLVSKRPNEADGRSTEILPTAAGRELLIAGRERRVRALALQIEALGEADRKILEDAATILRGVVHRI